MIEADIDILMITYNRPAYTRMSLPRLLETCDDTMRVWVWHNGDDQETLDAVQRCRDHPRMHRFHHSPENRELREPTNWLWSGARGTLLGKVDDDCLMPQGWAQTLRQAHHDVPSFGAISCWLFREEDFDAEIANRKIRDFDGGHRLMLNCWVGGSGYLMKRACLEQGGLLCARVSFTQYCIRLARCGWTHGWYYPFLYMDHMDDPRSTNCRFKTEQQFRENRTLSAIRRSIHTLEDFRREHHKAARRLQIASPDPRDHVGWRPWLRRRVARLRRILPG